MRSKPHNVESLMLDEIFGIGICQLRIVNLSFIAVIFFSYASAQRPGVMRCMSRSAVERHIRHTRKAYANLFAHGPAGFCMRFNTCLTQKAVKRVITVITVKTVCENCTKTNDNCENRDIMIIEKKGVYLYK